MNNDWFYWNYEPRSECIFIDDKKILLEPGKYIIYKSKRTGIRINKIKN